MLVISDAKADKKILVWGVLVKRSPTADPASDPVRIACAFLVATPTRFAVEKLCQRTAIAEEFELEQIW